MSTSWLLERTDPVFGTHTLEKRTRQSRLMPGRAGSSGEVCAYAIKLVCWRCDGSSRPPWPLHLGRLFNRPQLSGHPQHDVLDGGCDGHVDGRDVDDHIGSFCSAVRLPRWIGGIRARAG